MKCKNCNEILVQKEKEENRHFKKRQFCNRSCSATFNNKGTKRGPKPVDPISMCACGNEFTIHRLKSGALSKTFLCPDCRPAKTKDVDNRTKQYYYDKGLSSRQVSDRIRTIARRRFKGYECEVCDYDLFVDGCHIIPVADFANDIPLKVINSRKNIRFLCPNHHRELDSGFLHARSEFDSP